MGDVTHILPVLHCLKRGIAFVSSLLLLLDTTSHVTVHVQLALTQLITTIIIIITVTGCGGDYTDRVTDRRQSHPVWLVCGRRRWLLESMTLCMIHRRCHVLTCSRSDVATSATQNEAPQTSSSHTPATSHHSTAVMAMALVNRDRLVLSLQMKNHSNDCNKTCYSWLRLQDEA